MKPIMHLAFPGDHFAVRVAQLLKDRYRKGTPEQFPVMRGKRSISGAGEDNEDEIEGRQTNEAAEFLIGELQRCLQGRGERLRAELFEFG